MDDPHGKMKFFCFCLCVKLNMYFKWHYSTSSLPEVLGIPCHIVGQWSFPVEFAWTDGNIICVPTLKCLWVYGCYFHIQILSLCLLSSGKANYLDSWYFGKIFCVCLRKLIAEWGWGSGSHLPILPYWEIKCVQAVGIRIIPSSKYDQASGPMTFLAKAHDSFNSSVREGM